jgi:ABC-2 type transport system ATP-binding protein
MNERLLVADGLTKIYGNQTVVDNISFSLNAGEILALLGPNGAGKTTTIKMILGLVLPTAGYAGILGHDMGDSKGMRRGAQHVGAVLEGARNAYWRLSVLENLRYFGGLRGLSRKQIDARAQDLLSMLGLEAQRDVEVRKFSRGMQQKAAIANALIHDPEILVLDEPTLGLDVEASRLLEDTIAALAASGKTVLLTTHAMDLAQRLAGRIFVINQGREVAHAVTAALLKQFDTRPIVVIKTGNPLPDSVREALPSTFPAVTMVDGALEWAEPAQKEVLSLYAFLVEAGCAVTSVIRREPTLEEVFLTLTGNGHNRLGQTLVASEVEQGSEANG